MYGKSAAICGVAPFFILTDGQRERSSKPGVDPSDEGYVADDHAE